jgi:hypothetical protein
MSDMRQFGVVICRHPIENPKWNSKGGHLDAHCAYVAAPGPPGVRKLWPFWPMEDPGLVEPRGIKRHFERSYADGEWDRTASPNSQLPISCFHGSPRCSWEAPAALASDASLTPDVQRVVVKSRRIARMRPNG